MEKRFEGQVVVVTGASAGIGRALVRAFPAEGADVGLIARGADGLEAAALIEEALGPIDIWVNNAMVSVFSPIKQLQPDEVKRVTDVTYHGYVWGTMAALRRMLPRDRGTIVQVGSALAYRGIRCRRRIARRSTPSRVSAIRCGPSFCTTEATSACAW